MFVTVVSAWFTSPLPTSFSLTSENDRSTIWIHYIPGPQCKFSSLLSYSLSQSERVIDLENCSLIRLHTTGDQKRLMMEDLAAFHAACSSMQLHPTDRFFSLNSQAATQGKVVAACIPYRYHHEYQLPTRSASYSRGRYSMALAAQVQRRIRIRGYLTS